jgi:hypothetical protein
MKATTSFDKYPIRVCRSLLDCELCGQPITMGQYYYDGKYGRRAHEICVERLRTEANYQPTSMAKED